MKTFSLTDVGRVRESNQDYVYTSESPVGNLPNLFIVADGMGGHNAGDFASKYTVEQIVSYIEKAPMTNPVDLIRGAVTKANASLMAQAKSDTSLSGMGTTVVIATIVDDCMYVANVGDSRLYLLRDELTQITRDHSLVQEMVRMGEMDASEAKSHPDKNIITRAVGAFEDLAIDFFEEHVEPGDVILMCTDGLSNMVDDTDIRQMIQTGRDVVEKVQRLVEAANRGGGKDNITVAVIQI
ncbi:MAG: Stp1/IreP family PP2C-type Ser/Thr phosphatase [Lachnospiraceae bacterium]|nr:Stp1/IreP family PP2C-type Ser/Thr phosphatase [Lachnospiraceae bacterium]